MRQRICRVVIGSVLAVALAGIGAARLSGAGGQVWHVPGDFPTIQAAVDAAAEGDTILVAPGIYVEHVVVSKSHLTLRGAGPISPVERPGDSAAENVVLDGTGVNGLGIGIHVLGTAAVPVTDVQISNFEVRNYERGISLEERRARQQLVRIGTVLPVQSLRFRHRRAWPESLRQEPRHVRRHRRLPTVIIRLTKRVWVYTLDSLGLT